jgi:hypothetical protein
MEVELKVADASAVKLDFGRYKEPTLGPLDGFCLFGRHPRKFSNPHALADCFFYNLYISHFVRDWPRPTAPPHPGIFREFFSTILSRLIGSGNTLTLFVNSVDRDYFNAIEVIEDLLAPRKLEYILLPNPWFRVDRKFRPNVGQLVFTWPSDFLDYIVQNWFDGPWIEIEGYISPISLLPRIAELYFGPDTEERVRDFLRAIEIGFRVWPDHNGLLVLTDKLDADALAKRLRVSDLNPMLEKAAERYADS